jgi:dCMP deaminase
MSRPPKDKYYLNIAKQVNERSTCFRNKGGAIIVRDDQIVATGYVGAPRKTKSCLEREECLRDKLNIPHGKQYEMCRSVHAEMNAIINAARAGVSLLDGDMYIYCGGRDDKGVDSFPCFICKKMIINAGLNRVVVSQPAAERYNIFKVGDWAREWQEQDILEDSVRYGRTE